MLYIYLIFTIDDFTITGLKRITSGGTLVMIAITLSGILYLIPFFIPQLSYVTFISIIPILQLSKEKKVSFLDGFIWGTVVFSIHLFWLFIMFANKGLSCLRISLFILTIAWFSIFSGLWFSFFNWLYKYFNRLKINKTISWIGAWFISSQFYFTWTIFYSLLVLEAADGYPFFNMFIPLAYYPFLLWGITYLGFHVLLCCLILFQIFLTLLLDKKKIKYFVLSMLWIAPFLIGIFVYNDKRAIFESEVGFVRPWWYRSKDAMFCGYRMSHELQKKCSINPALKVIVLPESTFGADIYKYEEFIPLFCECKKGIQIVFGSQRKIDCGIYMNSCLSIKDDKIVQCYDKTHLMPLIERIPYVLHILGFANSMIQSHEVFSYPNTLDNDDVMDINNNLMQVFICSELFYESKKIKGLPILFLCNDYWFSCNYIKKLVPLFVDYIALKYSVSIIYITTEGSTNLVEF